MLRIVCPRIRRKEVAGYLRGTPVLSVGPRLSPVTGTPIEKTDATTRAVFGDYI